METVSDRWCSQSERTEGRQRIKVSEEQRSISLHSRAPRFNLFTHDNDDVIKDPVIMLSSIPEQQTSHHFITQQAQNRQITDF